MCLAVVLFGFISFGTHWASWTRVSDSFPRLGKLFFAIISLNNFCGSFSLPFLGPLYCEIYYTCCCPRGLLKYLCFLKFCFHFLLCIHCFGFLLTDFFYFIQLLLNPSSVFCHLVINYFWYLYFLSLKVLTMFIQFVEHFYEYYFELFIRYIACLCSIRVFFWICFILWFGTYLFPHFVWLPMFVYMY